MLRQVLKSCAVCCDFAQWRRRFSANTDNDAKWICHCLKIERWDQIAISAMDRGKAAVAAWTRGPVMPHVHAARGVIARVGNIAVELAGVGRSDWRGARAASRDQRGCGEHNSKRPKSKRPKSKRRHQMRFHATLAAALHVPESSPRIFAGCSTLSHFCTTGREQGTIFGGKSWR